MSEVLNCVLKCALYSCHPHLGSPRRHNWLPGFFPHAQGGFNVLCIPPHWSVPVPLYHCSFQTNMTLYMGKIFQFLSHDVALDHLVSQHVSIFTTQSTVFLPYSTAPNPLYFYHVSTACKFEKPVFLL